MFKKFPFLVKIASLTTVLIVSFGLSYAYAAWSAPTAPPPGANIAVPLNTGSAAQTKKGSLTIVGNLTANGGAVSQVFSIPNTGGSAQWVKLGTFNANRNGGDDVAVKIVSSNGYNAMTNQNQVSYIHFKTSWVGSVNPSGFVGDSSWYSTGQNTQAPSSVKWVANVAGTSATTFTLYAYFGSYTGDSSFYTVDMPPGTTWTNIGATGQKDPGASSSSVLIATNEMYIGSTVTVNDIYITKIHKWASQLGGTVATTTLVPQRFYYNKNPQSYTVPVGVTSIKIVAYGAQGGSNLGGKGGEGGKATGNLVVTPGQVLNVYVGGAGGNSTSASTAFGGWNGGGGGYYGPPSGSYPATSLGGGGGASDVRVGGIGLNNRVIVAAGGGGSTRVSYWGGTYGGSGGAGGGFSGSNGTLVSGAIGFGSYTSPAIGGSATSGGNGACWTGLSSGCYPSGFFGGGGTDPNNAGGGGGGWWGGGSSDTGGAGGSSYIGGVLSGSTTSGVNKGDGSVVITPQ